MALLMLLVSIAMIGVNGNRPHIKPNKDIAAHHTKLVNDAKALYGNLGDDYQIKGYMESFSHESLQLYRGVFDEYFNRDQSFEETKPDPHEFYKKHKLPATSQVYILAAGTFATNEATPTSDFDFIIIVIDPTDPNQASYAANYGLKVAVESYGKKLLENDKVYKGFWRIKNADGKAASTGMNVDISSEWVMAYKSLEDFEKDVHNWKLNIAKEASKYTTLIQSTFVYGYNIDQKTAYHELMRYFWKALPTETRIDLFRDTVNAFYLRAWKKSVKNEDHFSFKHTILRPLTLPTVYFYELAYKQHIHSTDDHQRAKSTLDRWNALAKYGYLNGDAVKAIEPIFLWAHKEQLKANLLKPFADKKTKPDETVYIYHGAMHQVTAQTADPINANLEKVKVFMEHMISQFAKLENNENWKKPYNEIKGSL